MSESQQKGIDKLSQQLDAKVESYFSSCTRCGACADACLFYTETEDPRYTPIYKAEPLRRVWKKKKSLLGKLGLVKSFTEDQLAEWEELVYDGCSMCGRCSMVCPVGVDVADLISRVKVSLAAAGMSPPGLVEATDRAITTGSPMGIKLPALQAQIRHIEEDTGLTIPIDVQGADYMALLSSMEIINFPEYIEALARIFKQANVSWTISSEAFEATNSGLQIGDYKVAGELVERVVAGAEKLGVKYVISPECGHAYNAIRWGGPNWIGRPYSFEVIHILELLDELKRSGRLKTEGGESERLTFHDPCQIVRRGGVEAQPIRLLKDVAPNYVKMRGQGHLNWCCGGGGGVSSNERAESLRLTAFNRKKSQLDKLNVDTLVTACANCRLVIEEGLEANEMDLPVEGLTEVIARHLVEEKSPA